MLTATKKLVATAGIMLTGFFVSAQSNQPGDTPLTLYSGIEVGSKGVKMSLLEIRKNAKNSGAFHVIKDTSVNTDFISFSPPTFAATLYSLNN